MDSHFGPWVIHCIIYNPLLGSFRGHPPCVHLYHPDRISGGVIPKKNPLHSGLDPALQSYFCYLLLLSFSSKPFMCSIWSTLIHSTHLKWHLVVFLATANDFVTITVIIREATASQQMIGQRCVTLWNDRPDQLLLKLPSWAQLRQVQSSTWQCQHLASICWSVFPPTCAALLWWASTSPYISYFHS